MRLTEITYPEARPIDGYGPGFFRVGGELHRGAILVLMTGVTSWEGFADSAAIVAAANEIDVLLVGTGAEIAAPPKGFRQALEAAGIGVEVMASPSAARSYNVLLSERRRVAAALVPV